MTKTENTKFQLWRFLLSPRGRISRRAFALYILPTGLGVVALRWLIRFQIQHTLSLALTVANFALGVAEIILLWPKFATTAKRLQDFGWPGVLGLFTSVPFFAGAAYGYYYVRTFSAGADLSHSPTRLILGTVFYGVWAITVALMFIPGTKSMNRYGPPPRRPQALAEEVF